MPKLVKNKKAEMSDEQREHFVAWREAHSMAIGSSEAAAAVGFSKYLTPLGLYRKKLGLAETSEAGEAARWGQRLEEPVMAALYEEFGVRLVTVAEDYVAEKHCPAADFLGVFNFKYGGKQVLLRSKERPFMVFSPDGFCSDGQGEVGIVEAKTTSLWKAGDWGDNPPDEVLIQCWHGMAVTGLQFAIVPVLIGGQRFEAYLVERNEDTIAGLIAAEQDFMGCLERREAPPWVEGDDLDNLKSIYAKPNGEQIDLPGQAETLIAEWLDVRRRKSECEKRAKAIETSIRGVMGDSEFGKAGQYEISLKETHNKGGTRVVHPYSYRQLRVKGHR